jgi:hypothetical protein
MGWEEEQRAEEKPADRHFHLLAEAMDMPRVFWPLDRPTTKAELFEFPNLPCYRWTVGKQRPTQMHPDIRVSFSLVRRALFHTRGCPVASSL